MGQVTVNSLFLNSKELKEGTVDAIRTACLLAALEKAVELFGPGQRFTIRDLNATDMSYTNNIFTETSHATVNQWNAMAFGAFTVATATVLGIYGLKLGVVNDATIDFMPVTGVRIDVGGARIAQWHVQCLDMMASGACDSPVYALAGVTKSPIIVAEDITVTIYEYTRTASTVYTPVWLGIAVEKEGVTLKP